MARIRRMRSLLRDAIVSRGTPGCWDHITQQIGMFSYTGLTESQSRSMVEDHHVYMLSSGRINVAGLSEATVGIAADAIHAVVSGLREAPASATCP
jgi:aspartate aminotransferase, cytoplasmic